MKKIILGVKFDNKTKEELIQEYIECVENKKKVITMTPNLDILRLCYKKPSIRKVFNQADYSTVDGVPLLWIAKWLKIKGCIKVSGSDLGIDVLKTLNEKSYSLFLFGGKPSVAEKAKEQININYPNINVVGCLSPEFGYENNEELCKKYIDEINSKKADFVFICTGAPKSEIFFVNHKDLFGPSCYLSIGATIDFIAGNIKRAPKWMSKVGLEWLYRLTKDFRRLFKRYWLDGWFLIKVFFMCLFSKKKIEKMNSEIEKL